MTFEKVCLWPRQNRYASLGGLTVLCSKHKIQWHAAIIVVMPPGTGEPKVRLLRSILIVLILSLVMVVGVRAESASPFAPPELASAPSQIDSSATELPDLESQAVNIPGLKAVLIVGPIDGDHGSWTNREKDNMELAARELEAHGVTVHRFYTPNNSWSQIVAAARGAHFLLYRGHGIAWSSMPHPTVGGLALKDDLVSADRIRAELDLAPNAIVMLYACFSAGSSSIDNPPIDSAEAHRRVAQYSSPFLDKGVAGYYANWLGDAFQMFVRYLFGGAPLGQAYETYWNFNSSTVERHTHPSHPGLSLWLSKDYWNNRWEYNNAFVGRHDQTLQDLFGSPVLQLTIESVTHIADPLQPPNSYSIGVHSANGKSFNWTATVSPSGLKWLNLDRLSGTSGEQISLDIMPGGVAPGTYQAEIRFVADGSHASSASQTLMVTLHVASRVKTVYLPLAR